MLQVVAALAVLACAWGVASPALAAPSDLDTSWDGDGVRPVMQGEVIAMRLQPDGRLVVAAGDAVLRFDASGQPDGTFGIGGAVSAPYAGLKAGGLDIRADGRIDVLWRGELRSLVPSISSCDRVWARYLASGAPDTAFNMGGSLALQDSPCCWGLDLDSAGRNHRIDASSASSSITTAAADGTPLGSTSPFDPARWNYWSLRVDASDRLVVALRNRGTNAGFAVGRTGAPAFGLGGVAVASLPGESRVFGALPLEGDKVLAFGTVDGATPFGGRQAVLVRFTADGAPDPSFGTSGVVILSLAGWTQAAESVQVAVLQDGRLFVAAEVATWDYGGDFPVATARRMVLARLTADGRFDASFAEAGVATVPLATPAWLRGLSAIARPGGQLLVAVGEAPNPAAFPTSHAILQFAGGDLSDPLPADKRFAVEYFHAEYGHYFMTADADEIAGLDAMPSKGWARTGRSFRVFDGSVPTLQPVCRFWSDQAFAPKSSHFYTPYIGECMDRKRDPSWVYERDAFALRMPVGPFNARSCPFDTVPLYRAFNMMQTGAPNHRYVTDSALLDQLIAHGWVFEGEAATRVFACLPLQ